MDDSLSLILFIQPKLVAAFVKTAGGAAAPRVPDDLLAGNSVISIGGTDDLVTRTRQFRPGVLHPCAP